MKRLFTLILLLPVVLTLVLSALLYVPVVQDWVCRGVVSWLNATSDDWQYEVGKVRLSFPLQLSVHDVRVSDGANGPTLLSVGTVQTGLDDIPLRQNTAFVFNSLHIADVTVHMDSLTEALGLQGELKDLAVKRIELDLDRSDVKVREVVVTEPNLLLSLRPAPDDTTTTSTPWAASVGRVVISQGSLRMDSLLAFSALDLEAEQIAYSPERIAATVNHLHVYDDLRQLELNQLAGRFAMEHDRVALQDLDLQLAPADYLRGEAVLDLSLMGEHPNGVAEVKLEAAIDSTNLSRLAASFAPELQLEWPVSGQTRLAVDAQLENEVFDLRTIMLEVPHHLSLEGRGSVRDILDEENRVGTVKIAGELTRVEPLLTALMAEPKAREYRVPDNLAVTVASSLRGSRISVDADVEHQKAAIASVKATYDVATEAYQLRADAARLMVHDFVPAVPLQHLSMQLVANGRHFDFGQRHTRLDASLRIDSLTLLGEAGSAEQLRDIMAEASLLNGNYSAQILSDYPALRLDTYVEGTYRRDTVSAAGHLDVLTAQLAHLPLLTLDPNLGALSLSSQFEMGYNWADDAHIRLAVDTLVYDEGQFHPRFDDITVTLDSRKDLLRADLVGGDALLSIRSDKSIAQLPAVFDTLLTEVNRQLQSYRPDVATVIDHLPRLDVELHMERQNPFSQMLEREAGIAFDKVWLTLHNDHQLTLQGEVHNYMMADGSQSFDTIAVALRPAPLPRAYDYRLHAQHHELLESQSYDVHADGRLLPDSVTVGLKYVDGRQKTLYDLLASTAFADDTLTLHLEQGPTLYEQPFAVNPDNYVRLMHYTDLEQVKPSTQARLLLDGPRDLKMQLYTRKMPQSDVGNQLLLLVRNLDLDYAHSLMDWSDEMQGTLSLTTAVDLFPDSVHATLRSGISRFGINGYKADTVAFDATALLAHGRRDVSGTFALDSIVAMSLDASLADSTNIRASIRELPLPMVSAFLPSNMQLWGTTSGQFSLVGKDIDHAVINGGIAMNEAGLVYTDLNARLRFPSDTIRFGRNRLLVHDYKILAANDNPITLRGLVDFSKNISDPAVSLTVVGDNVRLINNKRLELKDQYIYGRLPISPNLKIAGSLSKLNVTGSLNVLSGTDLQFFMQDDPLQASSKVDQLVEFVRFDQIDRYIAQKRPIARAATPVVGADESLNVQLRIEIADDAKVTAHLAGTDNNKVDIVGGGSLTLQMGSGGNLLMNGTYSMNDGEVSYKLPILPMVKRFRISPSSNLVWQGSDPTNPDINITAVEEVRTTVSDNSGTRVVKFLVSIKIVGTLDALQLTFDCDAPEDGAISTDIASLDADERSKAALMLLIAQTYIGPGNSSSMGLGTANAALNSMLNREMDSMLSGLKGTNIDVGIDTYNTDAGSTRTDYSVKVSQRFLNDRFRATIGGQMSSGNEFGQISGARLGDISLEWLIKKDGSHLMKLFRTTNYESVLEGELVETGVSYVQERSGFRLRQLFIPSSKKRQAQLQQLVKQMQEREEQEEREARRKRMGSSPAASADSIGRARTLAVPADSILTPDTIPSHELQQK